MFVLFNTIMSKLETRFTIHIKCPLEMDVNETNQTTFPVFLKATFFRHLLKIFWPLHSLINTRITFSFGTYKLDIEDDSVYSHINIINHNLPVVMQLLSETTLLSLHNSVCKYKLEEIFERDDYRKFGQRTSAFKRGFVTNRHVLLTFPTE